MDHESGAWHERGGEVEHIVTDQAVRAWRHQSLIRAGFTAGQAEMVATDADIDIHWLIDLTRKGCPHGTACRIAGVELPQRDLTKALAAV